MPICDYTNNTNHTFYENCCNQSCNISTVGTYCQDKIEKVLQCNPTSDEWVEFYIPEIVDIPEQKPNIEDIISVSSCIELISQRVIKTPTVTGYIRDGVEIRGENIPNSGCTNLTGRKLIIEGLLKQKIVYTSDVPEQTLHSAHFEIPFSVFIIVAPDTPLSQNFRVYPYIEDIFACKLSERSVFKNTTIFIKAVALC